MAFHDLFTNLISPKLALGILRKQIEGELNKHFEKIHNAKKYWPGGDSFAPPATKYKPFNLESYIIDINIPAKTTFFIVDKKPYSHADGEKLTSLILAAIKAKMKDSGTIEKIIINYGPKKITVTTAYILDNQKQVKQIDIS